MSGLERITDSSQTLRKVRKGPTGREQSQHVFHNGISEAVIHGFIADTALQS
jgi:hypothetical protein